MEEPVSPDASDLDHYFKVAQPTPQVLLLAVGVEHGLGAHKLAATYAEMLRESYPDSLQAIRL